MRKRRVQRVLATLALIGALGVVLAFVTRTLSYVTTHGVSMLPAFHTGDLAIVRSARSYHVGEIVAYYSPLLHTTVLHRIVAEHSGLFTFKGDNNPWIDPLRLPASSIRGALLLHLPRVGTLVSWAVAPLHAALIGICISLIAAAALTARKKKSAPVSLAVRRRATSSAPGWAVAGAVVLAGAGAFAALAFTTPLRRASTVKLPYREQVSFGYAGQATKGTTYPDGTITTGEPIFVKLVRNLGVRASYALTATRAAHVEGTMRLTAAVVDGDGWSRQLVATSPISFTGPDGAVAAAVPVPNAVGLIKEAANETGIASGADSVSFTAQISMHGTIGGAPVSDHFSVPISFELSTLEINLLPTANGPAGPVFAQLQSTRSGSVQQAATTKTTIDVVGHHLAVPAARAGALIGLVLGALLLVFGLAMLWRRRATGADERALRRVHRDLVPIESDPSLGGAMVVDVATLTALVDIADRAESLVLDYQHENGHTYFTDIDDVLYRFGRRTDRPSDSDDVKLAEVDAPVLYRFIRPTGDSLPRDSDGSDMTRVDSPLAVTTRDDERGQTVSGAMVVENDARDLGTAPESEPVSEVLPQVPVTIPADKTPSAAGPPTSPEKPNDVAARGGTVRNVTSREPAVNDAALIRFPETTHDARPEGDDETPADAQQTELGLNAWFAEEMHQDFLDDPRSVSDSWRSYFAPPEAEATDAKIFTLRPHADSDEDAATGGAAAGSNAG